MFLFFWLTLPGYFFLLTVGCKLPRIGTLPVSFLALSTMLRTDSSTQKVFGIFFFEIRYLSGCLEEFGDIYLIMNSRVTLHWFSLKKYI